MFSRCLGLAIVTAALCLGAPAAHAQSAPVSYWIPGWPLGFGGGMATSQSADTWRNFPGFSAGDASGFSTTRYNFSNGWFVGSERGTGLNGLGYGLAAFGTGGLLSTEGVQFGYNFKGAGGLPITLYGGLDTLKLNGGIGNPFMDTNANTASGYSAHAGVEFRPTSNLSLSLGASFTQQPDANSLLPGASPFAPRH
jgi:opacity protein-like surface antigen